MFTSLNQHPDWYLGRVTPHSMSTVFPQRCRFVIRIISRRVVIVQCCSIRLTVPPVKSEFLFLSQPGLRQFAPSTCKFFETWLARRWDRCILSFCRNVEPPFKRSICNVSLRSQRRSVVPPSHPVCCSYHMACEMISAYTSSGSFARRARVIACTFSAFKAGNVRRK